MEVIVSGAGVAGVADIGNDFSLLRKLTGSKAFGVALQMSVIKHESPIGAELVDRCATAFALEEFDDLAVGSGHNRRSRRRRNVDRVVDAALGARIRECIQQLIRPYAHDRNNEFQRAEITSVRC